MTENERLTTECCGKYITFQGVTHNQCKQKLGEYEAIGTIEEFKALKEKNEPKELAEEYKNDFCEWEIVSDRDIHREYKPMCSEDGFIEMTGYFDYEFCPCCGKKIKVAPYQLILSILVYTLFSRMFDLMQPPVVKHSIAVA